MMVDYLGRLHALVEIVSMGGRLEAARPGLVNRHRFQSESLSAFASTPVPGGSLAAVVYSNYNIYKFLPEWTG